MQSEQAPVLPEGKEAKKVMLVGAVAVAVSLIAQNISGSMILGGLVGVMIFSLFGIVKWEQNSDVF